MGEREKHIKTIAGGCGAALTGIASIERLMGAPPSADPRYLLPSAQSIVSFAVPFNHQKLRDFFSKKDWLSYNKDKKENFRSIYSIGDALVAYLQSSGFKALAVEINCVYRPEENAKDATDLVDMVPDFSHRYGAVAAGIGRLGWSGNLMTARYGSAVQLGTVITSADLKADPLIEENPCDRCKMCVASCPMEMIHKEASVNVTVAGITEEIARKRTNNCCFIGCSGYHGLSPDKKWSTWSPYRIERPFPKEDQQIDELCTHIRKKDPYVDSVNASSYSDFRKFNMDPGYIPTTTCSNCANVCWENRRDRMDNRKILSTSGVVVLRTNGERTAVDNGSQIVEIQTPFISKVAMLKEEYEAALKGEIPVSSNAAHNRWDEDILNTLNG